MAHPLPAARSDRDVRLEGLDALRGVAAVMVMLHHELPALGGVDLLPKAYLAVDFFFMLSGFVVALAYEDRIARGMPPHAFLRARLARLYPVMALGILAGAAVAFLWGRPAGEIGYRVLAQGLFLPIVAGAAALYVLDGVQWSLACELVANVVHATLLSRLRRRGLSVFVAASFVLLLAACFRAGSLGIGDTGRNIAGGIPRVLFSYGAGVLLYRLFAAGRLPRPDLSSGATLAAFVMIPVCVAVAERMLPGWLVEPLIVATAFPVLIAAGVRLRLAPPAAELARCGGRLSYPLYALHLPIIGAVQRLGIIDPSLALALGLTAALALAAMTANLLEPRERGDASATCAVHVVGRSRALGGGSGAR